MRLPELQVYRLERNRACHMASQLDPWSYACRVRRFCAPFSWVRDFCPARRGIFPIRPPCFVPFWARLGCPLRFWLTYLDGCGLDRVVGRCDWVLWAAWCWKTKKAVVLPIMV